MPLLNIHLVKGGRAEDIAALQQAIHEAMVEVFDAYRKANPARPAALASNDMGPARQDLVTRKIVSLNAWKSVGR